KIVLGVLAGLGVGWLLSRLVHGYGFIGVFICALVVRSAERHHEFQAAMHSVIERLEVLLTLAVLLMLGVAATRGVLDALDWRGVVIGVLVLVVVRPLTAMAALAGRGPRSSMSPVERWAISFLGVRGVGSLYYLAYATGEHDWAEAPWLWATVTFTVVLSVLVHGVTTTPIIRRVERAAAG
ncbi:MAG: cation:proton antiporter, partial [Nocardioidaceae bacterium]|nr:cation:proton antiporter [Nocardioidaceae bacterium]